MLLETNFDTEVSNCSWLVTGYHWMWNTQLDIREKEKKEEKKKRRNDMTVSQ